MRVRRKASPSTSAGDQARARPASAGSAARAVPPPAMRVATETGSRTRPARRVGQDADGPRQRRQREQGTAGQQERPHRQRPPRDVHGCQRVRVAAGEGRGRRPVEGAARQEGAKRRRPVVCDGACRHVADVPSRLVEAPHEVDVLATAQAERRRAPGPSPRPPARRAPRSARTGSGLPAVPAPAAGPGRATTAPPRSGRARSPAATAAGAIRGATAATTRVVEVAEQRTEPRLGGHAVGVHEGHERCCARAPAPRCGRPTAPRSTPTRRTEAPWRSATSLVAPASADASSTTTHARSPSAPSSRSSWHGPVAHRHDDRHVFGAERGRHRPGHERPGRHQAARQRPCRPRSSPTGAPVRQRVGELPGPRRDPEQAQGAASEEHGPAVEARRRRVLDQRERAGERCRRARRAPRGAAPESRGRG